MLKILALIALINTSYPGLDLSKLYESWNALSPSLQKSYLLSIRSQNLLQAENLLKNAPGPMKAELIDKSLTSLKCLDSHQVAHSPILTVIDYSLPSNQKRLWVFDLTQNKLLFHTYVSHGLNSGELISDFFSNKNNSKASSIGVFTASKAYYGRHGLSLQLRGLDAGFNDNAERRAVVMHGGFYVEEPFIKRYGRAGRSWGCPAVPDGLVKPIIDTIKDKAVVVAYYPNEHWLSRSKYLTCTKRDRRELAKGPEVANHAADKRMKERVVYVDLRGKGHRSESDPILVMSADNYQQIFHCTPPLGRMLRRQINHAEYIALSDKDFAYLIEKQRSEPVSAAADLAKISFVVPVIKMVRGYYETNMELQPYGPVRSLKNAMLFAEKKAWLRLRSSDAFIRWLGL